MDKVLLIDAQNSIWRASIGFGPDKQKEHGLMSDESGGWDTHDQCQCGGRWIDGKCERDVEQSFVLIFNFFRNLRPIIELFSPDKCYFVLEGHPQFRYDLYAEYKANRIVKTASKQDLKDKVAVCRDEIVRLIQFLPITVCRAVNYEADDTIATLCHNMRDEDLVVMSSDTDYIQLLQKGYKKCRVYNPIKKQFMEAPTYPYVAWKCLAGDKSDNIPSLLSPKKVLTALNDPGIFAQFMAVEENRANFNINRQLIEFRMVPEEEILLTEGKKDFPHLKEEFTRMKFESIINDRSWEKYTKTFDCLKY